MYYIGRMRGDVAYLLSKPYPVPIFRRNYGDGKAFDELEDAMKEMDRLAGNFIEGLFIVPCEVVDKGYIFKIGSLYLGFRDRFANCLVADVQDAYVTRKYELEAWSERFSVFEPEAVNMID